MAPARDDDFMDTTTSATTFTTGTISSPTSGTVVYKSYREHRKSRREARKPKSYKKWLLDSGIYMEIYRLTNEQIEKILVSIKTEARGTQLDWVPHLTKELERRL